MQQGFSVFEAILEVFNLDNADTEHEKVLFIVDEECEFDIKEAYDYVEKLSYREHNTKYSVEVVQIKLLTDYTNVGIIADADDLFKPVFEKQTK
jgi:hypothetical protein